MEWTIQSIIAIVSVSIPLLTGLLTFLTGFIKNKKAKTILENTIKITNEIQPFVVKAEQFLNYTGEEKKEYVLTRLNDFAIKNKIPFDSEEVSKKIDEIVSTTKNVNQRDKDKLKIGT